MISVLVGRNLPAQFEESLSKINQEAKMQLSDILNNSTSKPLNAQLVVLNSVGQSSPARLATGSAYNVTLTQEDPAFPETVSQRELSWATLCLLNKLATQFETLVKAWPTKEHPLYVCVPSDCVGEIKEKWNAKEEPPPSCLSAAEQKEVEKLISGSCSAFEDNIKKWCEATFKPK
jgi:hypothetical protein